MQEVKEGSCQRHIVYTITEAPSSTWYSSCCCCFRSSPRRRTPPLSPTPTARRLLRADNGSLVQNPAWYHGDTSWEVAAERLETQDSDCFLLSKSRSQPGKYVLNLTVDGMTLTTPLRLKPTPHKQIHQTGKKLSETCSSPELTLLVLSQASCIQHKRCIVLP